MKIEELPKHMQESILMLKHNSATIEADVLQALDEAGDLKSFQENVKSSMDELKREIDSTIKLFCWNNGNGIIHTHYGIKFE